MQDPDMRENNAVRHNKGLAFYGTSNAQVQTEVANLDANPNHI